MVNRIAAYMGDTNGEVPFMRKGPASVAVQKGSAEVSGEFIADAISARWIGTDKSLAEAAGIAISTLADMKVNGTKAKNSAFRKLCVPLGIDLRSAARGKLVAAGDASGTKRQDLHDLLNRIIGTENEDALERVMRGLVKAG
jgi:hypothetical protein